MEGMTMDYPYTVNDIITKFHISKTTFYNQVKKNIDFFNTNSTKIKAVGEKNKPFTRYNQSVFDFFASQYGTEEAPVSSATGEASIVPPRLEEFSFTTSPEAPDQTHTEPQDRSQEEGEGESLAKSAQAKIEALQAEIEALKAQLETAEGERAELIKQNGNLLLLLNQELLLPAPKKSIGDRIKALFSKQGSK